MLDMTLFLCLLLAILRQTYEQSPTFYPTKQPTVAPTEKPTSQPTGQPTSKPSVPTSVPTQKPTFTPPTPFPTFQPSANPTLKPTWSPSASPTLDPTLAPTENPTGVPTGQPTRQPSVQPTGQPTVQPTGQPTSQPSGQPTGRPTTQPSVQPTSSPTGQPSGQPTGQPSEQPTGQPSGQPTAQPTSVPSGQPTGLPSGQPSGQPTDQPSSRPTGQPTTEPSGQPTGQPSSQPSGKPTTQPSSEPSGQPSMQPSAAPTTQPSSLPTGQPSSQPSGYPTTQPSMQPSAQPTSEPSAQPSAQPSVPTSIPSGQPSAQPIGEPTNHPSPEPYPDRVFNSTGQRYQALDAATFSVYEAAWKKTHANWINLKAGDTGCADDEPRFFPVCVDGYMLRARGGMNNVTCSKVQCIPADAGKYPEANTACFPTPSDTMDYVPPERPELPDNNSVICPVPLNFVDSVVSEPQYGFDLGVPPDYTPIRVVRLNFTGVVRGQAAPGECGRIIENAEVDAWQVNPLALDEFTATTMREEVLGTDIVTDLYGSTKTATIYDDWSRQTPHTEAPSELREISCRGYTKTDAEGRYHFETLIPPSHGPPRYIMIQVTAPGYQTLTTRMYFEQDDRLQHLTTLNGALTTQHLDNLHITHGGHASDAMADGSSYSATLLPGEIAQDPRVIPLTWKERPHLDWTFPMDGMKYGYFTGEFDIVMTAMRPNKDTADGDLTSVDVDGVWLDEGGGLIKIESKGNHFHASQVPHQRTWGSVTGVFDGDTIRGVNFLTPSALSSSDNYDPYPNPEQFNPGLWSTATSTGVILHEDPTTSGPITENGNHYDELSIQWTSEVRQPFRWFKQHDIERVGYRYLKLVITRDTHPSVNSGTGELFINEIMFYEGALGQHEMPALFKKMQSPKTPSPQRVTCSSFTDQFHHCFRAFDGIKSSNSSWRTMPVGSSQGGEGDPDQPSSVLSEPQWALFDFGPGRDVLPSALKIVCGAQDPDTPKGCPRTFALYGSTDNKRFSVLYKNDLYDYNNDYAHGGKLFTFFQESPTGRPDGHRCGSCNMGPTFRCSLDAYDGTCASKYCTRKGVCGALPACPAGEYLHYHFVSEGIKSVECKQCAAGRYGTGVRNGTELGQWNSFCSGPCTAGYYCPKGSTSPTERECGGEGFFCPEGSPAPIPAGAGRHTVFEMITSYGSEAYLTDQAINASEPMGENNYYTSPRTHYNTTIMVSNDTLTGGNITYANVTWGFVNEFGEPLRPTTRTFDVMCQYGHYCHLGVMHPCPVGRYGDRRGLATVECSDSCVAGEYCPSGSVTPTVCEKGYYCPDGKLRVPCPPGSYGARTGLLDRACSGKCKAGYYCLAGSTNSTQEICPAGKYGASSGLQSAECSGECEPGYYCPDGSTNATFHACGDPSVFCPGGSGEPQQVRRVPGHYTYGGEDSLRQAERVCEAGFYCLDGVRHSCPRGTYGAEEGLYDTELVGILDGVITGGFHRYSGYDGHESGYICSGLCDRGYYCPVNSSSPQQIQCPPGRYGSDLGSVDEHCTADCPLGHYCPAGSADPIKCPSGTYGNTTGLTSASCSNECWEGGCPLNRCQEGFYCPEGSVHARQYQCGGAEYFCPTGSPEPSLVKEGFYTIGPFPTENARTRVDQKECPVGHYCKWGLKIPCPQGTYGNTTGLSSEACDGECPLGHFCPPGSYNATQHRCPAGRYGGKLGLFNSACSGLCSQGYHCPEASVTPYEVECGVRTSANRTDSDIFNRVGDDTGFLNLFMPVDGVENVEEIDFSGASIAPNPDMVRYQIIEPNSVFCPEGSASPLPVLPGYYSIGQNKTTRYDQVICPMGAYCVKGVIYDCPAGRYGRAERLDSANCTGPCAPGHYCPRGSTSRHERPCPIGRYGATEGLRDSLCTGPCKKALDCPLGSTRKQPQLTRIDSAIY